MDIATSSRPVILSIDIPHIFYEKVVASPLEEEETYCPCQKNEPMRVISCAYGLLPMLCRCKREALTAHYLSEIQARYTTRSISCVK